MSDSSTLALTGDLTLATVATLFRDLTPKVTGSDRCLAIDLGATGRIDSAGLALLLEWQSRAIAEGAPLQLNNVPDDILRLARLCEAAELLGLEPEAGNANG